MKDDERTTAKGVREVDKGYAGFEQFVRDRSVGLLRTAYLLTGSRTDAEDLLQEALTGLARSWPKVERAGNPEAYARRALHNAAIDGYRRRSARPVVVGEPSLATPASGDPFADSDRRVTLQQALARLTPRQRAVLVLRFYEQHTEAEAARVLDCSVSTVKSQTRHALRRLRELNPHLAATFDIEPTPEEARS